VFARVERQKFDEPIHECGAVTIDEKRDAERALLRIAVRKRKGARARELPMCSVGTSGGGTCASGGLAATSGAPGVFCACSAFAISFSSSANIGSNCCILALSWLKSVCYRCPTAVPPISDTRSTQTKYLVVHLRVLTLRWADEDSRHRIFYLPNCAGKTAGRNSSARLKDSSGAFLRCPGRRCSVQPLAFHRCGNVQRL